MTTLGTDEAAKWHVNVFSSLPHQFGEAAVAVADV